MFLQFVGSRKSLVKKGFMKNCNVCAKLFVSLCSSLEVAGGTDIIKKTMESFCIPTAKANALIDLHAYDGSTALAAVEEPIVQPIVLTVNDTKYQKMS